MKNFETISTSNSSVTVWEQQVPSIHEIEKKLGKMEIGFHNSVARGLESVAVEEKFPRLKDWWTAKGLPNKPEADIARAVNMLKEYFGLPVTMSKDECAEILKRMDSGSALEA